MKGTGKKAIVRTRSKEKKGKKRRFRLTPKKRATKSKKQKKPLDSSPEPRDSEVEKRIKEMQASVVKVRTPGSVIPEGQSSSNDSEDDDVDDEELSQLVSEFAIPLPPDTPSPKPLAAAK